MSATHLINMLHSSLLHNKSSLEKNYGTKLDYTFLKVFGCRCFPNLRPYNTNKFMLRSLPCNFLGYDNHYKGYKCLASTGRMYVARNVIFDEFTFPYANTCKKASTTPSLRLIGFATIPRCHLSKPYLLHQPLIVSESSSKPTSTTKTTQSSIL